MAMKTTFMVQTFAIKRKRLVPGDREVSPTESGALKKAEAMAGRLPGTAAIKVVADDETGELEAATILGQFGEIPEDFAESLPVPDYGKPLQEKRFEGASIEMQPWALIGQAVSAWIERDICLPENRPKSIALSGNVSPPCGRQKEWRRRS